MTWKVTKIPLDKPHSQIGHLMLPPLLTHLFPSLQPMTNDQAATFLDVTELIMVANSAP